METKTKENAVVLDETTAIVPLKQFDKDKAFLKKVAQDYSSLVITKETFEESKKARAIVREYRYAIQNTLVENKGILNTMKSEQEKKAEELVAILIPTEQKLDAGIKAIETEAEEEKKRKERELEEKRMGRVNTLLKLEMKWNGTHYVLDDHSIDSLQIKNMPDEEFMEFLQKIKDAHAAILLAREEEAKAKKAEQERVEKQRLENEAEAKRLESIRKEQQEREDQIKRDQEKKELELKNKQREQEEKLRLETEAADKKTQEEKASLEKEKAEFKTKVTNQRIYQLTKLGFTLQGPEYVYAENICVVASGIADMLDEEWETDLASITAEVELIDRMMEEQRLSDEKKAAERIEALRPDKEKLAEFLAGFSRVEYPILTDPMAKDIIKNVESKMENIKIYLNESIKNL